MFVLVCLLGIGPLQQGGRKTMHGLSAKGHGINLLKNVHNKADICLRLTSL